MPNIYSADFETTTQAWKSDETRVWMGAYVNIEDHASDDKVTIFSCIEDFMWLMENHMKDKDVIYFHNLKFDGSFIINGLMADGFEFVENLWDSPLKRAFSTMISDQGIWYSITVRFGFRKTITIKNSMCLVQGSVASIGKSFGTRKQKLDMDYDRAGGDYDAPWTKLEIEYMKNDVLIMAEVLHTLIYEYGMTKLTAGANALEDYRSRIGDKAFNTLFPSLTDVVDDVDDAGNITKKVITDEDTFVRNAYKGGISWVNNHVNNENREVMRFRESKHFRKLMKLFGMTVDRHSMYPSEMHSSSGNLFPVGRGKYFKGAPKKTRAHQLWVARGKFILRIKEGKMPCVQIKKSGTFKENEWLEFVGIANEFGDEPVELTITNVDWELINECYDIEYCAWVDGYAYKGKCGIFDKFIDYWYEIKRTSSGAKKQCAKIMLNSFYGKFGTRLSGRSKLCKYENGMLKFTVGEEEHRDGVYIPVAAFTTSYARAALVRGVNENFYRVVYTDTDSMHLIKWDDPKGIVIDNKNDAIGTWGTESYWDGAVFLRQKTYMEHVVKDSKGKAADDWVIKCAGMPTDLKYGKYLGDDGKVKTFPKLGFDDFYIGAHWETGKLQQKQVKGGVLLLDVPFEIKAC